MPAEQNPHHSSFDTSASATHASGAADESHPQFRLDRQPSRSTESQPGNRIAGQPTGSHGQRTESHGQPAGSYAAESEDDQTTSVHTHPKVTAESQGAQRVVLPEVPSGLSLEERSAEALRLAQEAFAQTGYWVAFYKAVLAKGGVVDKLFSEPEDLDYFYTTNEFSQIQQILTALRTSDLEKADAIEPLKMLTIRIPRSMQAALMEEAQRNQTSINKLCVSKLLCPIDPALVPQEHGKVKGRKPQA